MENLVVLVVVGGSDQAPLVAVQPRPVSNLEHLTMPEVFVKLHRDPTISQTQSDPILPLPLFA